jgi:hypothetical protein
MKKIFFPFLGILFLLACNKDKFKTVPQAEIKTLTPDDVIKGSTFKFVAQIRDKEGDLKDTVYLVTKRYDFDTEALLTADTIPFSLKNFAFPNRDEIEIEAFFGYGEFIDGTIFQNLETSDRKFAIGIIAKDEAGNRSEYVESDKIVLHKL